MDIEPWVPIFYEAPGFGLQDWITIGVGIGGAILGALVGGWISWSQARADRAAQDRRDHLHNSAVEKGRLIKAQYQASLILSDVVATVTAINASLQQAHERGLTSQPLFTRMMPVIGHMRTPVMDIDSIGPLIMARENDLVQAYIEMHAKHEVLTQALDRFDKAKEDLNERVSPFMKIVNGVPSVEMTAEREAQLRPYFDGAQSLATQIMVMAEDLQKIAEKATFGIGPAGQRIFKDDDFPVLEPLTTKSNAKAPAP